MRVFFLYSDTKLKPHRSHASSPTMIYMTRSSLDVRITKPWCNVIAKVSMMS